MGRFEDFRKNSTGIGKDAVTLCENPTVPCEIQEPMERMVAKTMLLDERAHNFLGMLAADSVFLGTIDVDEEWRCWMEGDRDGSRVFFDETLEVLDGKAYDYFLTHYAEELRAISDELAGIGKMGQSLNEYKIFKTSLYNVFNNKNSLPTRQYFEQVYSRATDYNMTLERQSKETMDLAVSFRPLAEVNRGGAYIDYDLLLVYNPNHKKEGFMYSVKSVDAFSAEKKNSGVMDLPIYSEYSQFEEQAARCFLNERKSVFYYDAMRAQRTDEKNKYNIPADYFEGTYIDTKKLIDVSEKSYRYGNSDIYIPKSQVAFAGDKLYMKKWLFYKLKEQVGEFHQQRTQAGQKSIENTLSEAKERCAQQETVGEKASTKEGEPVAKAEDEVVL